MIIYLIKISVAIGVFLAFYKIVLEDIPVHNFKRLYLLITPVISLALPVLPFGFSTKSSTSGDLSMLLAGVEGMPIDMEAITETTLDITQIIIFIIAAVGMILLSRSVISMIALVLKSKGVEHIQSDGISIILLDDDVTPHTFLDTIYVNRYDYENDQIDMQLICHEKAHAQQWHSLDIIFIEILRCMMWFNPLINMYKESIQLNHEFLADQAVIKHYKHTERYQYLLLKYLETYNQIKLASNINFHLTKKRFKMMNKKSSRIKSFLASFSVVPLILILALSLGTDMYAQRTDDNESNAITSKLSKAQFFKNATIRYRDKNGNIVEKQFDELPDYAKAQLHLPPPPPPPPGTSQKRKMESLEKGTLVDITKESRIKINNSSPFDRSAPVTKSKGIGVANDPPSPPSPPVIVNREGEVSTPNPAPPAPPVTINHIGEVNVPSPPPPPPPLQVRHLAEQGVTVYLNGHKVKTEVAKTMCESLDDSKMQLKENKDGTKSLYITL